MHQYYVKEKNEITYPWQCLTKSKPKFEFSTSSSPCVFYHLSIVWVWICSCMEAVLWIFCYVCICPCVSISACSWQRVFLWLYLNLQQASYEKRMRVTLKKYLSEFYKGLSHWLQLNSLTHITNSTINITAY